MTRLLSITLIVSIPFLNYTGDNRIKFNDHSKRATRVVKSPIIQFYSSVDNIGNFLPVMGIQEMLGQIPDTWCAHATVDWNFVNSHYKCGIIGGAGLFHKSFEPFWKRLRDQCKIPLIIWGLGVCLPDKDPVAVDKDIIREVAQKCDLINVRDELTASYYGLTDASISACPCIVYLNKLRKSDRNIKFILYSHHDELVNNNEQARILDVIKKAGYDHRSINNFQRSDYGLMQILENYYQKSLVVVTSRLHGAIIAYGLGIPYIMFPRDKKLVEFHKQYGNGWSVKNTQELEELLKTDLSIDLQPLALEPVLEFGRRAQAWVEKHCNN